MGGPFRQWAHQYDVPSRTQSGEGGMVAQSNKYPGSICGLRPIFVLFSHLFPMRGQQTDRPGHSLLRVMPFYPSSAKGHETCSLATDFPLFNLDAGSMPTLLDNTVSLPFLIQPRHGLVCMK